MLDMPLLYQQVANGNIYAENLIKLKLDSSSCLVYLGCQRFVVRNQSRLSPAHGRNYHIVAYMNGYTYLPSNYHGENKFRKKLMGTNDYMQRKMR
jgi:hypothetical protein